MASGIGAIKEEHMGEERKCVAVLEGTYFFYTIPNIILDTHFIDHILPNLCIPNARGRYLMTDQNNKNPGGTTPDPPPVQSEAQEEQTTSLWCHLKSVWRQLICNVSDEISEQLIKYAIQALVGLGIFIIFVVTSIVIYLFARYTGSLGILIRIVGWTISVLGAICCVALILRNTFVFIKYLIKSMIKRPPRETSVQENAGEGRVK